MEYPLQQAMIWAVALDFTNRQAIPVRAEDLSTPHGGLFYWVVLDSARDHSELRLAANHFALDAEWLGKRGQESLESCCEIGSDQVRIALALPTDPDGHDRPGGQLGIALNDRAMIMVTHGAVRFVPRLQESYLDDFVRFSRSWGFLLFEVAEGVLDAFQRARRKTAAAVEELYESLLDLEDVAAVRQIANLATRVRRLRKATLDAAEVFHALGNRKSAYIPESTQPHLREASSALLRIAEDLAVQRDTLNDAVNLYLGVVGNHTNRVVRRLTIVGTTFMPLTFLCGVYGMNMRIPETEWPGLYPTFWMACLLIAGALLWMMRRWKWL